MAVLTASQLAFGCGILGNIVSFLVYLAPLATFYRIYKKKSTEGFQSIPYSAALFSAMLYLYYAFIKKNSIMIITINSVGIVIETIYLIIFLIYATKKARIYTIRLLSLYNFGALGLIILLTFFLSKGDQRVSIVGWICAVISVIVFAAPLSIMRRVIKTRSVEFMPFNLSLCLTLCAVFWFLYGFLIKDYYIATPNILGFAFGIAQMILYAIYRNRKKQVVQPENQTQQLETAIDMAELEKQAGMETESNKPEDHDVVQDQVANTNSITDM